MRRSEPDLPFVCTPKRVSLASLINGFDNSKHEGGHQRKL